MINVEALGENGILLTKFAGWHDLVLGDVLAKQWPGGLPSPAGWAQNGGWIFKTYEGIEAFGIRPDIRARRL